jgi:hypothetical protein
LKLQKKRGRPPKSKSKEKGDGYEPSVRSFISSNPKRAVQQIEIDSDDERKSINTAPKKRGRPRKHPINDRDDVSEKPNKRGRPKKSLQQEY